MTATESFLVSVCHGHPSWGDGDDADQNKKGTCIGVCVCRLVLFKELLLDCSCVF